MDNNKPTLSYTEFQQKLSHSKSLSIQNDIKKFCLEDFPKISHEQTKEELSKSFQKFITQLIISFCKIWQINLTYQKEELYQNICDHFETNLTKNLYNKLFCSSRKEKEIDFIFDRHVDKLQFITPKMLDINDSVIDLNHITTAINKLAMINQYKSPKDKMLTFINLVGVLSKMYADFSKKETLPGAEEVFPLVIYTLIKSRIPKLKSNLNYYRLFRHSSRITYIEEYYFDTFNAAIEFIDTMLCKELNIEKDFLIQEMARCERDLSEKAKTYINPFLSNQDEILLLKYFNSNNNENDFFNKNKTPEQVVSNKPKSNSSINNTHLFNIDYEHLYEKYFTKECEEFTPLEYEQLLNDFKIILTLTDSFIKQSSGTDTITNKK